MRSPPPHSPLELSRGWRGYGRAVAGSGGREQRALRNLRSDWGEAATSPVYIAFDCTARTGTPVGAALRQGWAGGGDFPAGKYTRGTVRTGCCFYQRFIGVLSARFMAGNHVIFNFSKK